MKQRPRIYYTEVQKALMWERWHPHLMFFLPLTDPATWGAGMPGAPVIGAPDTLGAVTIFMVPVGTWSDGTAANNQR